MLRNISKELTEIQLLERERKMEIQLRSEENGITFTENLKEALKKAEVDQTIWKISFSIFSGERVIFVRRATEEWHLRTNSILKQLEEKNESL